MCPGVDDYRLDVSRLLRRPLCDTPFRIGGPVQTLVGGDKSVSFRARWGAGGPDPLYSPRPAPELRDRPRDGRLPFSEGRRPVGAWVRGRSEATPVPVRGK